MKPRSAKAKGRNLQNWVAEQLRLLFNLPKTDVKPAIMGEKGEDIKLSEKARTLFPFSIECKNLASIAIYKHYQQAEENAGDHEPLLVIKQNHSDPLVVMDAYEFFNMIADYRTIFDNLKFELAEKTKN